MRILVELTEQEISSLESCILRTEDEGYTEPEAWEAIRKIREAIHIKQEVADGISHEYYIKG